jgi:hypothetical protein
VRRKLRNEELHNRTFLRILLGNGNKGVAMRGTCCTNGRCEKYMQNFSRKNCKENAHGRRRRRWEDNTKKNCKYAVVKVVKWIRLAQGGENWRDIVNGVVHILHTPGNFLTIKVIISLPKTIIHGVYSHVHSLIGDTLLLFPVLLNYLQWFVFSRPIKIKLNRPYSLMQRK